MPVPASFSPRAAFLSPCVLTAPFPGLCAPSAQLWRGTCRDLLTSHKSFLLKIPTVPTSIGESPDTLTRTNPALQAGTRRLSEDNPGVPPTAFRAGPALNSTAARSARVGPPDQLTAGPWESPPAAQSRLIPSSRPPPERLAVSTH